MYMRGDSTIIHPKGLVIVRFRSQHSVQNCATLYFMADPTNGTVTQQQSFPAFRLTVVEAR